MTIAVPKIKKPKKQPSKRTLKGKADILWSKIIRNKAGNVCEWCGRTSGKMDAHHVKGKPNGTLRYELRNGVCLCFNCHRIKCHGTDPDLNQEYLNWIRKYKADDWDYLSGLKNVEVTTSVKWYKDNIKRLQEYLNTMEEVEDD
jgi:hypothetical protein